MTKSDNILTGFPLVKVEIERMLVTAKTHRLSAQWTIGTGEIDTVYYDPREDMIQSDSEAYDLLRYFRRTSRSHTQPFPISNASVVLADFFYERTAHQQIVTPFDLIMTRGERGQRDLWGEEIAALRLQNYGVRRPSEVTRLGNHLFDAFHYMIEQEFRQTLWVKFLNVTEFRKLIAYHGITGRIAILHSDAPHILIAFREEADAFAFKMASDQPVLTDLTPNAS